jgi:pentatricopeptide repeat protein
MSFRTVIGAYSHRIVSSDTPVQQAKELAAKAQQLFEDMHQVMGYMPNLVTCNTIINCWAKAREPERAEDVLHQMPQWDGLQPDIVTYIPSLDVMRSLGM